MSHLTILTGASRGMGLAIATQLCIRDAVLLCISRQTSGALAATAQAQGTHLTQWRADLADPVAFPDRDNFVRLKASNALASPAQAAAQVLAYLARADFGSQVIADVRDA